MIIAFADDGSLISASDLISMTYRTDLVPVPANVEFTIQSNNTLVSRLVKGTKLLVGTNQIPLTIVKVQHYRSQQIRNDQAVAGLAVVAVLTGCEQLIEKATKAVIMTNTTMSDVYRACGATITFSSDIPLPKFTCLKGQIPTVEIAKRLLTEGACIQLTGTTLSVVRLADLFKGNPLATYDPSAVQWIDNPVVATMHIPSAISTDSSANINYPSQKDNRPIVFRGGLDEREMLNMDTVLVTKAILMRPTDENLKAGYYIQVGAKKLAIVTGAHRFDTGSLGGRSVFASKAWLADLSA